VLFDGHDVLYARAIKTGWDPMLSGTESLDALLADQGLCRADVFVSATGYGRDMLGFADHSLTEISSHAFGAAHLATGIGGVIDIGGQDSKVIRVRDGRVADFIMNDKCAAGTGRFIGMACETLGTRLEDIDSFVDLSGSIPVNSMCTVFAESEIIGLLSLRKDRAQIMTGVLQSVAQKARQLVSKLDFSDGRPLLLTGGLSSCVALRGIITEAVGIEVLGHRLAWYAGAIGACVGAARQMQDDMPRDANARVAQQREDKAS
jgi:predicted CoA-substrate-specific enzyme activase